MKDKEKPIQVIAKRMTGLPLLTEVYGVFRKLELRSGNRRTVIYKSSSVITKVYSIKIKLNFNSRNSGLDYEA